MSEAIIEKVKKLIALGTNAGATEGERDNAMRMAHALLAKHNLEMDDLNLSTDRTEDFIKINLDRYLMISAISMAKLFFCFPYIQKNAGRPHGHLVHLVGRRDNIETAKLMTNYVISSIRSQMNKNKMGSSFATGAAMRIHERVMEIINNVSKNGEISQSMALAVISLHKNEDAANQNFLNKKGTELESSRQYNGKVNPREYEAGRQFGDKINLNRQLAGESDKKRLG